MKIFETPELLVEYFECEDVLTVSEEPWTEETTPEGTVPEYYFPEDIIL